ncbi:unnamed protein product [Rhodiola kirilowii]
MGRKPCCDKVGLNRGPWTIEEDHKLMSFVLGNGIHCWRTVPKLAGLLRCGKSCRLRWINYLRPDLKRGGFTEAEEDQIIRLHKTLGNRWSKIASHFDGRTDNEIKNHWNTKIKKRLLEIEVDPKSHELVEPKQTTKAAATNAEVEKLENNVKEGSKDELEKIDKKANNEQVDLDDDLLSNYEIFNGRLEVLEHWPNEESTELDGQSLSFSASMSEIETRNKHNLHQWFDEMESFFGFSDPLNPLLFTKYD